MNDLMENNPGNSRTIATDIAYEESLSLVEYLRSRYGMADVLRILHRAGSGEVPESEGRAVTQSDYAGLEKELTTYLQEER